MKKHLLALALLFLSPNALGQASSATETTLGFLSSATTGSAGCTTLGLGSPPCFVPFSASNPLPITTSGGTAAGVSSFSGDGAFYTNSMSTGAVTGTLGSAAPYTVWGNGTGSAATPGYTNSPTVLNLTTSAGGTLTANGGITAPGLATGTIATGKYVGLNSSNQMVLGAVSAGGTPGGTANSLQTYATSSTFGGSTGTGLYQSTTNPTQIQFLSAVTTSGIIAIPDNGADTTSIAVGPSALIAQTTTGNNNTALGYKALSGLTNQTNVVGIGYNAQVNAGYSDAVVIGSGATANGSYSVAIGYSSDTSIYSVAVGDGASAGFSGTENVSVGYDAGTDQGGGTFNTFVGGAAGANIVGSNSNTAVGQAALSGAGYNQVGSQNTAVGRSALFGTTSLSAANNTAIGYNAGGTVTIGASNTIIGTQVGSTTLTTGSDEILIGVNTAIDATASSESNAIHIGGTGGDWVHVTGTNTNSTEATTINGTAAITGAVTEPQFIGSGSAPTIAAGAAAGTSPTVSLTGTNMAGVVNVTAGTSTTASATLATITFNGTLTTAPQACILFPRNANAAGQSAMIYTTAPSTTAWTIAVGSSPVPASVAYQWGYLCGG